MRLSSKGRYAIAAVMDLASQYNSDEYVTVLSISERLGISKIYLEQVFSLLKKGNVVEAIKGSKGGYKLTRMPKEISLHDVLLLIEGALFEETKETVLEKAKAIEMAMRLCAFEPLDKAVVSTLKGISFQTLIEEAEKQKADGEYMFYI